MEYKQILGNSKIITPGKCSEVLQGKVALVTGASKGLGKGISLELARTGAAVVCCARSESLLKGLVSEIQGLGGRAAFCAMDAADEAGIKSAIDLCMQRYGGLDIVVANAGIYPEVALEEMTVTQWDEMMHLNLRGTFLLTRAAIEPLKARGGGRIIYISSITGPKVGLPGYAHYAASKAGMTGLMRVAALELAKYKITVNSVLPGNILTEGLSDIDGNYLQIMKASIPLGNLGCPYDIGAAVLFLASQNASFITGHELVVDGGQTLPESHLLMSRL